MMEILEEFSQKMMNSGHSIGCTEEVLKSGITNYGRKVKASWLPESGRNNKPLYMSTQYQPIGRWKKKVVAQQEWFKDKEKDTTTG